MGGNFLPVELAMLTAEDEKNNVMVKWATASESGNEGFEVEHTVSTSAPSAALRARVPQRLTATTTSSMSMRLPA